MLYFLPLPPGICFLSLSKRTVKGLSDLAGIYIYLATQAYLWKKLWLYWWLAYGEGCCEGSAVGEGCVCLSSSISACWQGLLKHTGGQVIQLVRRCLLPSLRRSQEAHCKFHLCVYLTYFIKSARSCKDFIAEVVSAWGMGEFAAGLEKQWELQNCCFYSPRGTSPKGIQGPTAKYEQHWWPGKCRVNNIITTKERNPNIPADIPAEQAGWQKYFFSEFYWESEVESL